MEIVLQWWQFILLIIFAQFVMLVVVAILRPSSTDDCASYWLQYAFIARSIMTEEQIEKADKMMEEKNEVL